MSSKQSVLFCTILFLLCIGGSIAIFLFGVGMETGDPIIRGVMKVLLENVFWIMVAFVVFNFAVFGFYRARKKISRRDDR